MYISRILSKKLHDSARSFPVVAVTGPRQSGKTTLVKHVFPHYAYVSLESPDMREFAQRDPRGFLSTYANGAIIDEVQRVPDLFSYIQGIVDERKMPGQFILTGSQHFLLLEKISQSLAGRISLLTLLPFSHEEFVRTRVKSESVDHAIVKGGYPRLYNASLNAYEWYMNYIQTYVERDVRQMKNVSDLSVFQQFIRLCAGRVGQLLNLSSLAQDCGISHNTARSWLSVLEASFIIYLLPPYHKNFRKRLVKMPKLFFYDTGLAASLLGIRQTSQLSAHPLRGGLFECLAMMEIMKYQTHRGERPVMWFWRDRTGHEVDCLLERGDMIVPIEIKSGKTITTDAWRGLTYWRALAGADPRKGYLVYAGRERQQREAVTVIGWRDIPDIFESRM